jgi:hypothetical protein
MKAAVKLVKSRLEYLEPGDVFRFLPTEGRVTHWYTLTSCESSSLNSEYVVPVVVGDGSLGRRRKTDLVEVQIGIPALDG